MICYVYIRSLTFPGITFCCYILAENLNNMSKNSETDTIKQKELMIKALEATYGNVRLSAKVAGITTQTHYRWMKEDNDYELQTSSMKDICYRDIKENLIDKSLKMIEKGNAAVLIKMMGIFLKDLPDEMRLLRKHNDKPLRVGINYVPRPNWGKREEQMKGE